jgi:hypothetical protein
MITAQIICRTNGCDACEEGRRDWGSSAVTVHMTYGDEELVVCQRHRNLSSTVRRLLRKRCGEDVGPVRIKNVNERFPDWTGSTRWLRK